MMKKSLQKGKRFYSYKLGAVKADAATWGLLEISESPATHLPILPPLALKPTHRVTEAAASSVKMNPRYVIPMLQTSNKHILLAQPASESIVSSHFHQLSGLLQESDRLVTLSITPV